MIDLTLTNYKKLLKWWDRRNGLTTEQQLGGVYALVKTGR